METQALTAVRERRDDGTVVVALAGEVTFANAAALARALDAPPDARVVVDLSAVPFIDSSGISALVRATLRARRAGGDVAVVHAPGDRPAIFDFKGVERLLRLFPSRAEALAALAGGRDADVR